MTPEEQAAQDVLDAQPDRFDPVTAGRVSSLTRTYTAGSATGLASVRVRVQDSDLECGWLRSFELSVLAGGAREGSLVLILLAGDRYVVADVILIGANSLG